MLIYATDGDVNTWISDAPPSNVALLLRSASILITDQISSSVYATDSTGLPTDADKLQALNDACCAQVAAWIALGINPAAGQAGVTPLAVSKKVGTAAVSYTAPTPPQVQARMAAADTLCGEAINILHGAGLLSTRVWTW